VYIADIRVIAPPYRTFSVSDVAWASNWTLVHRAFRDAADRVEQGPGVEVFFRSPAAPDFAIRARIDALS
jgi:hypothetical protein